MLAFALIIVKIENAIYYSLINACIFNFNYILSRDCNNRMRKQINQLLKLTSNNNCDK